MLPLFPLLWLLPNGGVAASVPPLSRSVDFSLVVADCFQADTVTVVINGQDLVKNAVVTSDHSTGVTDLGVFQDQQGLWVRVAGQTTRYSHLDLHQGLRVRLVLNGQASTHVVDLRKGWVIFVSACAKTTGAGTPARRLTVQQYKKSVALE